MCWALSQLCWAHNLSMKLCRVYAICLWSKMWQEAKYADFAVCWAHSRTCENAPIIMSMKTKTKTKKNTECNRAREREWVRERAPQRQTAACMIIFLNFILAHHIIPRLPTNSECTKKKRQHKCLPYENEFWKLSSTHSARL